MVSGAFDILWGNVPAVQFSLILTFGCHLRRSPTPLERPSGVIKLRFADVNTKEDLMKCVFYARIDLFISQYISPCVGFYRYPCYVDNETNAQPKGGTIN